MANPKEYTLVVDVDGTLCPIKKKEEAYIDLIPNKKMLQKLKEYHEQGVKIVLFSSRNMNTYQGNLGLINKNTAVTLFDWLKKWDVPYDEILFGKPWPGFKGFYVDDRSVRPNEFLNHTFEELEEICAKGREEQ